MRLLSALLLLLAAPAAAQTCAGALDLPLAIEVGVEPALRTVPIPVSAMFSVEATLVTRRGVEFHSEAQPLLPFDSLLAHPDRFEVRPVPVPLHGPIRPADTLSIRTRCGYYLVRVAITRDNGGAPMVVDLYNVPPHIPLRLDAPLVVRPGRLRLDLGASDGLTRMAPGPPPYRLIPTAEIERAD